MSDIVERLQDGKLTWGDRWEAADEITRLRAEVAKRDALMEAGFAEYERRLAKAVEALERSAEGWSNVLYFNIIASQYRTSVGTLRDEARAVLAELKGGKDDE